MIHIDFSESWLCKYHEEVQAMHFGAAKMAITLHTGVLYTKDDPLLSFCTISPSNTLTPEAIWARLDPILKLVKLSYPKIDTLHFFLSGPQLNTGTIKIFQAKIYSNTGSVIPLGISLKQRMEKVPQMALGAQSREASTFKLLTVLTFWMQKRLYMFR